MADARSRYRPILDRLLGLYAGLAAGGGEVLHVRPGYKRIAHIAHGWYMRVHRGAEAILILDSEGYGEEATGIRRAMIEHVVALRWLAEEGDKILDTVARGHAHHAEKQRNALLTAAWSSIDPREIDEVILSVQAESRDRRNDHMLTFVNRAKEYSDVHAIPGYLAEVARFHPSYESAIAYVELPSGDILMSPSATIPQAPFATTHVLEALMAFRQVFEPAPWEDELFDLVSQYRLVTDQVREQDGLPPVDWEAQGK